jgi:hypothetical protein
MMSPVFHADAGCNAHRPRKAAALHRKKKLAALSRRQRNAADVSGSRQRLSATSPSKARTALNKQIADMRRLLTALCAARSMWPAQKVCNFRKT